MKRLLIADDHAIVRRGLRQIVEEISHECTIDEAEDGDEALRMVREHHYDAMLLDISMPGRNVVDIIRQLKTEKPRLPILVISMYSENQYALRVLKAGASGYITKGSRPEQFVEAIRCVCKGEKYLSPSVAERLMQLTERDGVRLPHERLSEREFQILCMIAGGKAVQQIADELFLSVKTVSTHRSHILGKMGMQNNSELTFYAIKNGLLG